nr:hypothetical protein [Mycobacterium sp.]
MNDDNAFHIEKLAPIQDKIAKSESESIVERWEFGRALVDFRSGKQLPKGLRARITTEFDLEASEITRRMQLADHYDTREEVMDACTTYGGSWRRIIRAELVKRPQWEADSGWTARAKSRVDRLVAEAVEPARRDDLVRMLEEALAALKEPNVEAA